MSNLNLVDRTKLSYSEHDYLRFSALMQECFGLAFPENRRMELEIGVRRAFAASTCPDLDRYYQVLLDPLVNSVEMERLVNCLTIGESHFFRDAGQFDALLGTVLPELIERRRITRTLRIWSAGCASGEEPYSIAILLHELLPDIDSWNITLLGTDINTQHLERARRAMYGEWSFRENRARTLRSKYFNQNDSQYELIPEVRRMVRFSQLNLAEGHYPSYETNTMFMDLVLCRNVTIYFPEVITRAIADRFYNTLNDEGWLVIGHSEHSLETYKRFHARSFPDAMLYQRKGTINFTFSSQKTASPKPSLAASLPPLGQATPISLPPGSPVSSLDHKDCASDFSSPQNQESCFEQAQALLDKGYAVEACTLLEDWLKANPRHAPGCALMGKAYANQGNWPEAQRWCQKAISYDTLNLEAYYTLGLVLQHQGERQKAIEMLKKVVYIDPRDILGHFGLADLYYSNGQINLALKHVANTRRLLETRPIDETVPRSGDITVGRLGQTLIEFQQLWGKP